MNTCLNCRAHSLPLGRKTYVMGIINVTPDSFSDGGRNAAPADALATALEMERFGADILDIGGQSTRPGFTLVSPQEEWARIAQVLPLIMQQTNLPVSVDTFEPYVALRALQAGCHIINDVSGRVNPEMAEIVKTYSAGWVLMHADALLGCTASDAPLAVHARLIAMLEQAVSLNISSDRICLDPGIGFGKTMAQNRALIARTSEVKVQGVAYLLGASRKRVIGAALKDTVPFDSRDAGTIAAHTIGIMGGADIIRVHDCFSACQAAAVADSILEASNDAE